MMIETQLMYQKCILVFFGLIIPLLSWADNLLTAKIDTVGKFELAAPSRTHPIGGTIRLGERNWTIRKVSVHHLIGASATASPQQRQGGFNHAVFSSSFSEQTAVGKPWVASLKYVRCDQAYNSFLAVYASETADKALSKGEFLYAQLTEDLASSSDSVVYCFYSKPPDK